MVALRCLKQIFYFIFLFVVCPVFLVVFREWSEDLSALPNMPLPEVKKPSVHGYKRLGSKEMSQGRESVKQYVQNRFVFVIQ